MHKRACLRGGWASTESALCAIGATQERAVTKQSLTGDITIGILDSLAGALNNSPGATPAGAASSSAVVSEVLAMPQQHGGAANGLGSLMQAFQGGGRGHVFQSCVGRAEPARSPDQIQNALGSSGILDKIAQRTGMQPADVAQHLSTLLPQVVDHLTPNGQMHPGDAGSALEGLAQRLFHS